MGALGNLLGRAHDLNFLGERLRGEGGESEHETQKLLAVIETSQRERQRYATELGQHFFAERPRDFGSRLKSWLTAWESRTSAPLAKVLVG